MDIRKSSYLALFLIILAVFAYSGRDVYAAEMDTRYLVKSSSGFWKKSFGVRHQFEDGFTSDLTEWQLKLAKVFNIELVPVQKLFILEGVSMPTVTPVPDSEKDKDTEITKGRPTPSVTPAVTPTPTPVPSLRPTPSVQLPWGIKAVYGNNPLLVKTSGGEGVNVAILDTGVLRAHADLKNRVVQCKDFTSPKKPIIDGQCDDKNGHGTHVAGIVAADGGGDGIGIYGVAPESLLYAYRVCGNNGSCWSDDIAVAIRTAADQGAHIINLSLGSDTESSLIKNALSYAIDKNVFVVAAAGNDGPDLGSIDYPGANPSVVAVGAFDVDFDLADWSSRGVNPGQDPDVIEEKEIEFAAPGVIIESTWKDGGYVILSGTSMATPHITGLAAKLWDKDAVDPDSDIRTKLRTISNDLLPPGNDDASGFGFPHL